MRIFSDMGGSACLAIRGASSATSGQSSLEIAPVTTCMSRPSLSIMVRSAIGFAASADCAPSAVAKVAKSTDSETVKNDLGFKGWFTNYSIDVVTNALGLTIGCRCPQNSRLSAIDPNA